MIANILLTLCLILVSCSSAICADIPADNLNKPLSIQFDKIKNESQMTLGQLLNSYQNSLVSRIRYYTVVQASRQVCDIRPLVGISLI